LYKRMHDTRLWFGNSAHSSLTMSTPVPKSTQKKPATVLSAKEAKRSLAIWGRSDVPAWYKTSLVPVKGKVTPFTLEEERSMNVWGRPDLPLFFPETFQPKDELDYTGLTKDESDDESNKDESNKDESNKDESDEEEWSDEESKTRFMLTLVIQRLSQHGIDGASVFKSPKETDKDYQKGE
jgi:hypothetical protein